MDRKKFNKIESIQKKKKNVPLICICKNIKIVNKFHCRIIKIDKFI